jgi:hypothetical protein
MRLSVRGLAGKPVRLDDALADWRAGTMVRLTQAKIEAVWNTPTTASRRPCPRACSATDADPARSGQQRHQAQLGDPL